MIPKYVSDCLMEDKDIFEFGAIKSKKNRKLCNKVFAVFCVTLSMLNIFMPNSAPMEYENGRYWELFENSSRKHKQNKKIIDAASFKIQGNCLNSMA